jgi:hypothetical protein
MRQFRRGRQSLPSCVARTDTPVHIRKRLGRRGICVLRNSISPVIHTYIRQFCRCRQRLQGCVARTDTPVYIRERGGWSRTPQMMILFVYYESIKRKLETNIYGGVGAMKDYNLTLRNLRSSHTLSWSWNWIESRLITEMFVNVMGESENEMR